jgi:hypothetical protein
MSSGITKLFISTRKFLGKHSPEILTGLGISGMISTTILAVKATPKALVLLEEKRLENNNEKLTKIETIKTAWRPYIPAAVIGAASITCLIGASSVNHKRNAALTAAYAISENTLTRYRDKVIETLGEKKDKEIIDKVSQDRVNENPKVDSQIIISSKGNTLFMDSISGRYFKSDLDYIKKAINKLNRDMTLDYYVSLEDFYNEIGLKPTKNSSNLGWNLNDGLIEINISTCLTDDDQPCIVLDYNIAPRYEFDKLM